MMKSMKIHLTTAVVSLSLSVFLVSADGRASDPYREKARSLVSQMTLEEKAALTSGRDFWTTKPNERLEIPSIWLADGPHGLRKAPTAEQPGIGNSVPATSFPTASALASSWDRDLVRNVGRHLGVEAQASGVHVILGPGANIKRSPLGGRNFEYYSEDPILSGAMASAFVSGAQSEGVGTSLKHYAVNNQETGRLYIDAQINERALREIYLAGFEAAVKNAQPWTIMAAYNRVNGTYVSEHKRLLHDILKREWGFEGLVVSDWGAVTDRVAGIDAGLHLEMPTSGGYTDGLIVSAVKAGTLEETRLDEIVVDTLRITLMAADKAKDNASFDAESHHAFARRVAAESIVLLKNDRRVLPINTRRDKRIAIIGTFAKNTRYQGAGSSLVVPTQLNAAWEELTKLDQPDRYTFATGYQDDGRTTDELIAEAVRNARRADKAILFIGVPAGLDAEGRDRTDISLPDGHNALVNAVAKVNKSLVVVLMNGSAVSIPWLDKVDGVVEGWLSGQAGGGAIADVLLGRVNPSGKLSETFPKSLFQTSAHYGFPGGYRSVQYGEGVFVGYRHFDTAGLEPLFPFGFGLSYTEFSYADMSVSAAAFAEDEPITVTATIRNTGKVAGKEVVQLYVRDVESSVPRPIRELKDFAKIALDPGESKTISFELDRRDFAFFHEGANDWVVEKGAFEIELAASSRDIRLSETVTVNTAAEPKLVFDRYSPIIDVLKVPEGRTALEPVLKAAFNLTAEDMMSDDPSNPLALYIGQVPLLKLVNWSRGQFSMEMIDGLIAALNARD